MEEVTVYLAGGLFNVAERVHNLNLEKHLRALGLKVILPQREALKFFNDISFDIPAIAQDCRDSAANTAHVYVGNLDGPDADSGTGIEYGIAIISTGRAVTYRTDFRTAIDREVGRNAMFDLPGTQFIYYPCFLTSLEEVEDYYFDLAKQIYEKVQLALQTT